MVCIKNASAYYARKCVNPLKSGFTLVELAIVIVIIGLLISGVIGAQSLIDSAKNRQAITELNKVVVAYNTFIEQYDYPPGDLPTATTYWPSNSYITSNGNGNKMIEWVGNESGQVWPELVASDIYPITDKNGGVATWYAAFKPDPLALMYMYYGDLYGVPGGGNALTVSYFYFAWVNGAALKPKDTKSIDKKMDDGLPTFGLLRGANNSCDFTSGSCVLKTCFTGSGVAAQYNLTEVNQACRLIYYLSKD